MQSVSEICLPLPYCDDFDDLKKLGFTFGDQIGNTPMYHATIPEGWKVKFDIIRRDGCHLYDIIDNNGCKKCLVTWRSNLGNHHADLVLLK